MADGKLPNLELDFGALVLERGGEEVADEGAGIEGDDDGDNDDDDDDGEEEESEDDLVAHSDEDGEDAQLVGGWSVGGTEGRRRDQPKYVGAEGRAQFFEMYRADVHLRNRALSSTNPGMIQSPDASSLRSATKPSGRAPTLATTPSAMNKSCSASTWLDGSSSRPPVISMRIGCLRAASQHH